MLCPALVCIALARGRIVVSVGRAVLAECACVSGGRNMFASSAIARGRATGTVLLGACGGLCERAAIILPWCNCMCGGGHVLALSGAQQRAWDCNIYFVAASC